MKDYINEYITKLERGLRSIDPSAIAEVVEALERARLEQRMLFIIGNGGSAATASHMANDLQKLASQGKDEAFRAIALTDNVPLITAWGNDEDYTAVFFRQLEALAWAGDVLIAITGSGNSKNIIRAMEWAKYVGLETIALLGFDGGKARSIADHVLLFPEDHYGRVEDAHMILEHMIANYLADLP
ncbi:MAG: SIS domain-containing protein [Candidatus Bipolaricaulota bacterium]|nr:SIS domain-containing protein [Candidatus Bipolaricaulota bacterium]